MTQKDKPSIVYWLDNSLYLNITNRCSNSCYFCLKRYKQGVSGFNLKLATEPNMEQIIRALSEVLYMRSWDELVFCGFGEPTERLDVVLEVTRWVRSHYGRSLKVRLDTNGHGYLLNPGRDVVAEFKAAGVDKVSVSLNSGDKETYIEICQPTVPQAYEAVLDFIGKAQKQMEVEVSAVRLPEVDVSKVRKVAESLGAELKVRDYIPCFF